MHKLCPLPHAFAPILLATAAVALLGASASAQSDFRSRLRPITSPLRHAGVYHVATGTWSERTGTPWYADGVVFELADGGAEQFNRFFVLQDRVALFLEPSLDLRIGDAGQSYTLSRTQ